MKCKSCNRRLWFWNSPLQGEHKGKLCTRCAIFADTQLFRSCIGDTNDKKEQLTYSFLEVSKQLKKAQHIGRPIDHWSSKAIEDLALLADESIRYVCLAKDYSLMIATDKRCVISHAQNTIIPTNVAAKEFTYDKDLLIEHKNGSHILLKHPNPTTNITKSFFSYASLPSHEHSKVQDMVDFLTAKTN